MEYYVYLRAIETEAEMEIHRETLGETEKQRDGDTKIKKWRNSGRKLRGEEERRKEITLTKKE